MKFSFRDPWDRSTLDPGPLVGNIMEIGGFCSDWGCTAQSGRDNMAGGRRKSTHVSADDLADTGPEADPKTVQEDAKAEAEDSPPLLPWLEVIDEDENESRSRPSGFLGFGLTAAALVAGLGIYAFATRNPTPTDLAGPVDTETPPDALDSPAPVMETPDTSTPAANKGNSPAATAAKPLEAHVSPVPVAPMKPASVPASAPTAKTSGATSSIQLASYYSRQRAEEYWTLVSGRHRQLAALDHETLEGSVNGRTVYRLRAFGANEAEICKRLQSGGVPCLRIGHD